MSNVPANATAAINAATAIMDKHIAEAATPAIADALRAKKSAELECHAMTLAFQADVANNVHAWGSTARADAVAALDASRDRLISASHAVADQIRAAS